MKVKVTYKQLINSQNFDIDNFEIDEIKSLYEYYGEEKALNYIKSLCNPSNFIQTVIINEEEILDEIRSFNTIDTTNPHCLPDDYDDEDDLDDDEDDF
jgi:hypothetical protein